MSWAGLHTEEDSVGQHYMTYAERLKLEALYKAGLSKSRIARELGFCRKTIYNELRRGAYHRIVMRSGIDRDETHYSADKAQQIHDYNQTAKGRPLKIGNDRAYAAFLEERMLRDKYSPAAALAAARRAGFHTSVCISTLYSYIDKRVFLHLSNKDLWMKGRRRTRGYRPVRRIVHPKLPSIADRPEEISQRAERGHWEIDLVVGKAGSRPVLLTLTERCSRKELIFKLPDRKAATVRAVFDDLERKMGKRTFRQKFRSITTDNGSEFLEYDLLRRSIYGGTRFEVYYCHSYAAWEKGTNENHNRMIRRFFPKGTDFSKVTKKRVAEVQDWMNDYPRKILDWKCPAELAV